MNIKRSILLLILSCTIMNSYAQKKHEEPEFITYKCERYISTKEICEDFTQNLQIYKDRKKNFKNNKIKYFFNPDALVKDFTVPQTYNRIVDEVFKSLKKDTVSKNRYEIALKYKNRLKVNFNKNVRPIPQLKEGEKYSLEERMFVNDYDRHYQIFGKKIALFEKITNKAENLDIFIKSYPEIDDFFYLKHENDIKQDEFKDNLRKIGEKNEISCYYAQYELLRWDLDIEVTCK